jgi:hypothetical protein
MRIKKIPKNALKNSANLFGFKVLRAKKTDANFISPI